MTGIVDWAASRARMIFAFILLSLVAGGFAYWSLPKEGSPDIDVPVLFVSVPFPGISAEDSEKLLVKPLENKLSGLDGLKEVSSVASEGYAGVALEFEFGWDKSATIADVRAKVDEAKAQFPEGTEQPSINEVNFSEFPIVVISLSGQVPERTLLREAKNLQTNIEAISGVLEAGLSGHRDEMLEVIIDPLRLEAYNVTAQELINVVTRNNQLIAAGEIESPTGAFSVKIPASFDNPEDVFSLPVKVNEDRIITLGDIANIRLTFEDQKGTARYNGEKTVALQVIKRKGYNIISTVEEVRAVLDQTISQWPQELRDAVNVDLSMDMSQEVASMVSQLEASVITAICLVMIVVLASLGTRSALLVGFSIPTSFFLTFALMAVLGMTISNIVMFGLILAVGMLVDGAIVVVEYADKRISEGIGPMRAYKEAAKRMFWPVVSSTATTLCAFLPMLFWPGVPGEFMGNLPVTLIFVLSASLIVALVFMPVVGGVAGRISRRIEMRSAQLRNNYSRSTIIILTLSAAIIMVIGFTLAIAGMALLGIGLFIVSSFFMSIFLGAIFEEKQKLDEIHYKRSRFGRIAHFIVGNPIMPFVTLFTAIGVVVVVFLYFGKHNNGVEFFVETEPERAIAYVRARGNLSIEEKDKLVQEVEKIIEKQETVQSVFSFAGEGGLTQGPGSTSPNDAIGQVQIELEDWQTRFAMGPEGHGKYVLEAINKDLEKLGGIKAEIAEEEQGPPEGKPVHMRLKGDNWLELQQATHQVRSLFETIEGLTEIEDTLPLPGIDWQIDVDVESAGRYGADVATVGAMVMMVTRGILLDTMRVDSSDDEIDIRVRFPEKDRFLATLDSLRIRTSYGLVPLSNFITRKPVPKLAEINRIDKGRYFDVKADLLSDLKNDKGQPITATERRAYIETLMDEIDLPQSVNWSWTGSQEDQEESQAFLGKAFIGALGLMFIILLAQFNSIYNSVLVLLAVILSITGVLIGMLVMGQAFSIIMTGTGIVALAGIVVNNNIVLIDTYQEFSQSMPRIEAITRTTEARMRPVLLTTITTMAGLAPMMFGISIDFINGGYSVDAPTALWWKQLATAVVFGLGIATALTLLVTPSLLAIRVWIEKGLAYIFGRGGTNLNFTKEDQGLLARAKKTHTQDINWNEF